MKLILLAFLGFVSGFIAVSGYQYLQMKKAASQGIVSPMSTEPAPLSAFTLEPPSDAVSGTLTILYGTVKKFSRNDTEYKEASQGAKILLGESITTYGYASARADVPGIMTATLGPVAELVFANMFPDNFVLQQKSGRIDFVVTKPISARALHSLITIQPGEVIVTIIDTDMSITVRKGSVKFALVDKDNNTNAWNLNPGERANIDDAAREVFLVRSR